LISTAKLYNAFFGNGMVGVYNVNMDIELILKQYLKPVYNFAFRIVRDRSEAEDITQEVFVKIWKNIKKFDPDQNFKTWLFTIARNTTFDWLRKRKDISFSQMGDDEKKFEETLSSIEPLPDEIFIKKELAKELEEVLSKIRPDFREIILLHYTEDLTFEEISKIVNKPLNTVKSHHLRGLSSLRKMLLK
jgi:RNA polymerase sigma-70 factor (ECF subfamily)